LIKEWTTANQVEHVLNIPYYHQGNGRIERANRTIREAIKKTAGSLNIKLQGIIDNYNNSFHRAIGMTPNLALDIKNHEKVKIASSKYAKEFKIKRGQIPTFKIGQKVIVRNEIKENKNDDEFKGVGEVEEILDKKK
jgi:hypothetical protein